MAGGGRASARLVGVSEENEVFRVLIADDVQDLRSMLRLALELSGRFTVVAEAMDGAHAVDLAHGFLDDGPLH